MTTKEPEWVNLTKTAENGTRVDWQAFGTQNWEIRLTHRHYTGTLETTITSHQPNNDYDPPEEFEPWEAAYWDLTNTKSLTGWDLFVEAWEGENDWTLWVKGPLPTKKR